MADISSSADITDEPTAVQLGGDVEMAEEDGAAERSELPFAGEDTVVEQQTEPTRVPFIDYLTSPVVTLIVGTGENETILTAHQALLTQSPYFENICNNFAGDGSVSASPAVASPRKSAMRVAYA